MKVKRNMIIFKKHLKEVVPLHAGEMLQNFFIQLNIKNAKPNFYLSFESFSNKKVFSIGVMNIRCNRFI